MRVARTVPRVARRRTVPWTTWAVGWLVLIVLAGGIAQVVVERHPRRIEQIVTEEHVLPPGQARVTGTFDHLAFVDAVGPAVPLPLRVDTGTATIDDAVVDGQRASIVWQGGRPFVLTGGAVDLGPTAVTLDAHGATWPLGGRHPLVAGRYAVDAPVAVGTGGIAAARDGVTFQADARTTIDLAAGVTLTTPPGPLHLEGPGHLVADGRFTILIGDGRHGMARTHLDFGPGPFVVDLDGTRLVATLQGPLR